MASIQDNVWATSMIEALCLALEEGGDRDCFAVSVKRGDQIIGLRLSHGGVSDV